MTNLSVQKKPILLFCFAMYAEAEGLIESLKAKEKRGVLNSALPMRLYQASCSEFELRIITSGVDRRFQDVDNIGLEPATLMAYEGLIALKPDLIISAGTAGGFQSRGASIGSVYLSDSSIIFHDRHVPMPGFSDSAIGHYPCVDAKLIASELGCGLGIVSSGSSLQKAEADFALLEQHGVVAKEMEAAAIAWVAMLLGTPFLAIKAITNLVDEDNNSEEEFIRNFNFARDSLLVKVLNLLEVLDLATLDSWKAAATTANMETGA